MKNYEPIFGKLTETMILEEYKRFETIISFNQPIKRFRFLIKGKAKITLVHENGSQSIVHFLNPGEYVGELTFLDIEKEQKNVTALSDCTFYSVDMEKARRKLKQDPDFLFKLCQFIGDKMIKRTYFSSKTQTYELKNRLAAYILMSEHQGIYSEKHTETAEYLGVSYRHLLHTFKEFLEAGYLFKASKGYNINRESLLILSKDISISQ